MNFHFDNKYGYYKPKHIQVDKQQTLKETCVLTIKEVSKYLYCLIIFLMVYLLFNI